jgi:hypothetical protein
MQAADIGIRTSIGHAQVTWQTTTRPKTQQTSIKLKDVPVTGRGGL